MDDETYAALQRLASVKNLFPAEVIAAMVDDGRPPLDLSAESHGFRLLSA